MGQCDHQFFGAGGTSGNHWKIRKLLPLGPMERPASRVDDRRHVEPIILTSFQPRVGAPCNLVIQQTQMQLWCPRPGLLWHNLRPRPVRTSARPVRGRGTMAHLRRTRERTELPRRRSCTGSSDSFVFCSPEQANGLGRVFHFLAKKRATSEAWSSSGFKSRKCTTEVNPTPCFAPIVRLDNQLG